MRQTSWKCTEAWDEHKRKIKTCCKRK